MLIDIADGEETQKHVFHVTVVYLSIAFSNYPVKSSYLTGNGYFALCSEI